MSGIYIPGVEMPTGCVNCPLNFDATCNLIPFGFPDETNGSERRPNCPLIHVPDHGRLVDADALQKERWFLQRIVHGFGYGSIEGKNIKDVPTIIPADNEEGAGE